MGAWVPTAPADSLAENYGERKCTDLSSSFGVSLWKTTMLKRRAGAAQKPCEKDHFPFIWKTLLRQLHCTLIHNMNLCDADSSTYDLVIPSIFITSFSPANGHRGRHFHCHLSQNVQSSLYPAFIVSSCSFKRKNSKNVFLLLRHVSCQNKANS